MTIRLSDEHQKKLFQHIREKWGESRPCPMCHEKKWTVDGSVYRLAALSIDPTEVHSVIQPVATVRCTNCSFIALIHLTQSGIASADDFRLGPPQQPSMVPNLKRDAIKLSDALQSDDQDEDEFDFT
ncbi:MAG: hypothetical protein O7G85_06115 [Planctomycetota bacterium]|nr:hypothetical protein [Planctomycetota bacterium]